MAWVEMRMTVMGEQQVARAFEASARDAADLSEPLAEIGEQLIHAIGEQFQTEGARSGARWRPLSPDYEAWKAANAPAGDAAPLLVFTGLMRRTLLSRDSLTVTPQRLIYRPDGEHADIAAYHHTGAGNLPARRIVDLTMADRRQIERTFHEWLRRDLLLPFR